jgi:hypothetical protein
MVRVLNFCCFALASLCCLALYHVSEETRVAHVRLISVEKQIVDDRSAMKVLQADWERVSDPQHIQALAQSRLGLSDSAAASLASLDLLPRRGETAAAAPVQTASATPTDAHIRLVAAHAGN